jgi:hypothetical protein
MKKLKSISDAYTEEHLELVKKIINLLNEELPYVKNAKYIRTNSYLSSWIKLSYVSKSGSIKKTEIHFYKAKPTSPSAILKVKDYRTEDNLYHIQAYLNFFIRRGYTSEQQLLKENREMSERRNKQTYLRKKIREFYY